MGNNLDNSGSLYYSETYSTDPYAIFYNNKWFRLWNKSGSLNYYKFYHGKNGDHEHIYVKGKGWKIVHFLGTNYENEFIPVDVPCKNHVEFYFDLIV